MDSKSNNNNFWAEILWTEERNRYFRASGNWCTTVSRVTGELTHTQRAKWRHRACLRDLMHTHAPSTPLQMHENCTKQHCAENMGKNSRTMDNKNKSLALIYRYEFVEVFLPHLTHEHDAIPLLKKGDHTQSDVRSCTKARWNERKYSICGDKTMR